MHIDVRGIDRDGNSRSASTETHREPRALARDLFNQGWKYAEIQADGQRAAEVKFDPHACKRTYG